MAKFSDFHVSCTVTLASTAVLRNTNGSYSLITSFHQSLIENCLQPRLCLIRLSESYFSSLQTRVTRTRITLNRDIPKNRRRRLSSQRMHYQKSLVCEPWLICDTKNFSRFVSFRKECQIELLQQTFHINVRGFGPNTIICFHCDFGTCLRPYLG